MSKWQRVTTAHQSLSFSRRMMFVGGTQAAFGALLAGRAADVVEEPSLAAALAAAAALVHGRAAHRAQPGGPVSALAVADALPGTVAGILTGR